VALLDHGLDVRAAHKKPLADLCQGKPSALGLCPQRARRHPARRKKQARSFSKRVEGNLSHD
jgi:hypothetical protein